MFGITRLTKEEKAENTKNRKIKVLKNKRVLLSQERERINSEAKEVSEEIDSLEAKS